MNGADLDNVYIKQIAPRVRSKKNSPTAAIREWSVLTHSVMELTGPSPFGMDGNIQLWLHEKSLTQLLDMCDEVDKKFEMLNSKTLIAKQVWEAIEEAEAELLERCEYVGDTEQRKVDILKAFGKMRWTIADELGSETCHMNIIDERKASNGEKEYLCECSECGSRAWEPAHNLPLQLGL